MPEHIILTCASAYVLGRVICRIVLVGISECMADVICLIFVPSKSIHFSTSGGNHWKKSNRTPTASNHECNWAASSNLHEGTLSSSCGARESKLSRAKAPRKKSAKVKPRKQRRKQVDCRNAFKYLCRCESKNCARESWRETIRTTSLPGFRHLS